MNVKALLIAVLALVLFGLVLLLLISPWDRHARATNLDTPSPNISEGLLVATDPPDARCTACAEYVSWLR